MCGSWNECYYGLHMTHPSCSTLPKYVIHNAYPFMARQLCIIQNAYKTILLLNEKLMQHTECYTEILRQECLTKDFSLCSFLFILLSNGISRTFSRPIKSYWGNCHSLINGGTILYKKYYEKLNRYFLARILLSVWWTEHPLALSAELPSLLEWQKGECSQSRPGKWSDHTNPASSLHTQTTTAGCWVFGPFMVHYNQAISNFHLKDLGAKIDIHNIGDSVGIAHQKSMSI